MARYAYDVNTTQRLIDVHKQFQGGLKTVDTDDSLGAVFLRQAENISLSEFGFLEKRYGTYENFKIATGLTKLQGYWEYKPRDTFYAIYAADGNFYVNGVKVDYLFQENSEWRYPSNVFVNQTQTTCSFVSQGATLGNETDLTTDPVCGNGVQKITCTQVGGTYACEYFEGVVETNVTGIQADFQSERDINGVNIKNVMYFFTGKYPVYAKEVNTAEEGEDPVYELRFYMFSIDVPNYDELVVVGHNLLEQDYENAYSFDNSNLRLQNSENSPTAEVDENFEILKSSFSPLFPYATEGSIDFDFAYKYPVDINGRNTVMELKVEEVSYARSGIGVSDLEFIPFDSQFFTTNDINNVPNGTTLQVTNEYRNTINTTNAFRFDPNYPVVSNATNEIIYTKETRQITNINQNSFYNINHTYVFLPLDYLKENTTYKFGVFGKPDTDVGKDRLHFTDEYYDQNGQFRVGFLDEYPLSGDPVGLWSSRLFGVALYPIYGFNTTLYQKSRDSIVPLNDINISDGFFEFTPTQNQIASATVDFPLGVLLHIKSPYLVNSDGSEITEENMYEYYSGSSWVDASSTTYGSLLSTTVTYRTQVLGSAIIHSTKFITGTQQTKFGNILSVNLENLSNGVYDFRFKILLREMDVSGLLDLPEVKKEVIFYSRNVPITIEKLQDYPGSEGVSVEPQAVWTCNRVIEHFGKLMVWGSELMPNSVFYSFPDRPTYFPQNFYLDFGDDTTEPVEAVTPYMNILVVQTPNVTWGVRGNSGLLESPSPYIPFTINTTVGTIAWKSVRAVRNHLFFLSKQGIIALKSLYAADEQYNIDFVDRNIRNIVPQDYDAVGIQYDNQYWLNFPNYGITLRWYIDKKAWVLDSYGSYTNRITNTYVSKLGAWNNFNGVLKWQIVDGKLEFITHKSRFGDSGSSYIYKVGVDYSLPTDLGGDVYTKIETSYLNQNYPFHPKNYKELKLDFTIQNEYNASRDSIYEMDTNEHIVGSVHTIDNVNLDKNHRYRIIYNFSQHSADEDILSGGTFTDTTVAETLSGGPLLNNIGSIIGALTFSILGAEALQINSVVLTDKDNNQEIIDFDDFIIEEEDNFNEYIEFLVPNTINGVVDIIVNGEFSTYNDGAVMYDITYDNNLKIKNWVVSEESTLNLDNIDSYDQSKAELDIDFDSRLGQWVFGSSDFGNKVTALKTVKLSGKGYNAKLYLEDNSKSKWTLESLGITYKMKRARSR